MRAPGLTPAGSVSDQPVFSTDFFPTIAALADVEPDPQIELDGQSLIPYLRVAQPPQPRSFVWHYPHYHGSTWKPGAAIREGDWKLIEFYHWDEVELYHLGDDPGERHDLAAECPQVTARLRKKLSDWQQRMGARMPVPKQAAAP
jgi:arylsulfatase A-like enzyme